MEKKYNAIDLATGKLNSEIFSNEVIYQEETIIEDDDEKGECFRKYEKVTDSYRDHSLFLTQRERYVFLFSLSPTKKNSRRSLDVPG